MRPTVAESQQIAHMSYDDFANKRIIINALDAEEMKVINWMIKVQTKAIRKLFRGLLI